MEQFTIKNLYNLEETIAAELFEGAVYPWELLPKISNFTVKSFPKINSRRLQSRSGSPILQKLRLQHALMGQQLLMRRQR